MGYYAVWQIQTNLQAKKGNHYENMTLKITLKKQKQNRVALKKNRVTLKNERTKDMSKGRFIVILSIRSQILRSITLIYILDQCTNFLYQLFNDEN